MISLALASFAMFSTAQETVSEVVVPTKKHSVVTNSFGSNWFVGVNGGVNIYNGVYTNGESAFSHLSPALDVYVGKWHTPGFGWRVAYRGLNIQTYKDFDHTALMNYHFDAMFNLTNLCCGYKEERVYNAIPFVGVGWAGRNAYSYETWDGLSGTLTAHYGLLNTFRVAKRWAINLELAGFFFRNGFSSTPGWSGHDMMFTATAGVTFRLGKTGWDNAPDVEALQGIYGGMIDGLQGQLNDALEANKNKQNQIRTLENTNKALTDELNTAKEVKVLSNGMVDLKDFPLLMHIVEILDNGKADADMPWEAFTYEHLR